MTRFFTGKCVTLLRNFYVRPTKNHEMSENEKQQLQEELMYLMILIEFHNKLRVTVWKGKEPELEQ